MKERPFIRTCLFCGKEFSCANTYAKYCRQYCRTRAAKKRRRAANRPSTSTHSPQAENPKMEYPREYLDDDMLQRFGLEADPFLNPEDPEDVFLPPRLARLEKSLFMAIQRHQIVVLVGGPGSGKSTILRRLYGRMTREKRVRLISPASLDRGRVTHAALSVAIIRDLVGRDTYSLSMEERSNLLRTILEEQDRAGVFPALVIDEAHLLSSHALLACKHLWDSHTFFNQICILLIGQVPLKDRLQQEPALREVVGRTQVLELAPMKEEEVITYLRWRFDRVGAKADKVFDGGAYRALAIRAEHPLWINNLATRAMVYAFCQGEDHVMATDIGRA